ncbi:MAG: helix-turn-helix transcriptional regulator [Flavobacteriaceae bacterium]|nr:helix-turn-helix transcriptional regulator [Flavobacteriaceae bacterium]
MNNDMIGKNIRKFRELKGYSQEYMAHELDITQASYAKLESNSTKINVERIFTIAKILETDVADILELNKQTIFNQSNNITANAFGNVEKLTQDNKETYEKLIQAKDEQIALLKALLKQYNPNI